MNGVDRQVLSVYRPFPFTVRSPASYTKLVVLLGLVSVDGFLFGVGCGIFPTKGLHGGQLWSLLFLDLILANAVLAACGRPPSGLVPPLTKLAFLSEQCPFCVSSLSGLALIDFISSASQEINPVERFIFCGSHLPPIGEMNVLRTTMLGLRFGGSTCFPGLMSRAWSACSLVSFCILPSFSFPLPPRCGL